MASLALLPGTLGQRRAAHLLRRASFHYSKPRVDALASMTADQAVASLLQLRTQQLTQPVYDNTTTPAVENTTWINPPGLPQPDQDFILKYYLTGWWINEALLDTGIGHKMSFFWHQFMATSLNEVGSTFFYDYLALLRWSALGNFKKLSTKMISDNTMLRYLGNNDNSKQNPNENFAREFLELFTIGKGPQVAPGDYTHYTEDDIIQAARVLTGFRIRSQRDSFDPDTGIPRGTINVSRHDTGNKTFSPRFQNTTIVGASTTNGIYAEVDAFVNMIFAQDETARNLCRRLYRYFVSRNITPEIETDIITPLAAIVRTNNYEIKPVLQALLQSAHFFDADDTNNSDEIFGGMVKSPLELVLQALSFFQIAIPSPTTQNYQHYIQFYTSAVSDRMFALSNLLLFYPPDVAGYSAYHQEPDYNRIWFNSSSIIARYKLPTMLVTGKRTIGGSPNSSIGIKFNVAPWVRDSGVSGDPADAYVLVSDLLGYLLPEFPDDDRFNYFYQYIFLDNLPPADWTYEWQNYLATGNETEVKIPLERLITYIMFSPEYQLF